MNPKTKALIVMLTLLSVLAMGLVGPVAASRMVAQSIPGPSVVEQVVVLTNQERAKAGQPPLKANPLLAQVAADHSQAMADGDFFDHTNPVSGTEPRDRAGDAGYPGSKVGENIAQGTDTPEAVVEGWMNSPGHRANILDPDFREIGVGYVYDTEDAILCGDLPCQHYWTQVFGVQPDVHPLVINSDAFSTTTAMVSLYLYGQGWATEMRLRNDEDSFTPWESFLSSQGWTLPEEPGLHTVHAEIRSGDKIASADDSIYLIPPGATVAFAGSVEPVAEVTSSSSESPPSTSTEPAAPWWVLCPSSVDKRGHPTWSGNQVMLKGVVHGQSTAGLTFSWDPSDGSPVVQGDVVDPFDIATLHAYPDAAARTIFPAKLTVTDLSTGLSDSCNYPVVMYGEGQQAQVQAAIDDGLWYLHTQMNRYSDGGADFGFWDGSSYDVGTTGKALLAFEIQGHQADGDINRDPYVATVRRGLNYLFDQMQKQPLELQPAGDPDTNGNGFGLFLYSDFGEAMYEDAIAAMAVAASSSDPTLRAHVGGEGVVDRTYAEIAQDLIDYLIWAQVDTPNDFHRGGWRYGPNYSDADMSVTQWPVLAMEAAESNWGLAVPTWVKTELRDHFLKNVQRPDGGFDYTGGDGANVARTAAGMICLHWVGVSSDDSRVKSAEEYIAAHWGEDNLSDFYAMYGVMKGSRLTDPPITFYGSHSWYDEYADYLIRAQGKDGSWNDTLHGRGNYPLSTGWGVLILSRGVVSYVPPQPGSVEIDCPPVSLSLIPGDSVELTSQLQGVSLPGCEGVPGKPVDAMFVFDISSSAGQGPGSNWEQMVGFTGELIDSLSTPVYRQREITETSKLGLITSQTVVTGPVPYLLQELTHDYSGLRAVVEEIEIGGDTNISEGIRMAFQALTNEPPGRARAILLLLHDNKAIDADAIVAAREVSSVPIYLLINSFNVKPGEQITDELARQLVPESNILRDPEPDELRQFFIAVTEGDPDASAHHLRLVDRWSPSAILEFVDVSGPGGRVEGDEVLWDVAGISAGEKVSLAYKVKAPPATVGSVFTLTREIAYIDCNGYLQERRVCLRELQVAPHEVPTEAPSSIMPVPVATVVSGPIQPVSITLSLCPEESSSPQDLVVNLPPAPAKADVLFLFDVTSSMAPVIASAAQNADRIMGDLAALIPDVQFGVVSLADYPVDPYGAAGDQPYALKQAVTSDQALVSAALNALTLSDGGDGPESYSRALYEIYTDPAVGWRSGARHFIVSFGDSVAHDDDLNSGVPAPQPHRAGKVFQTGYAPSALDPGRDGIPGTPDDLDWQAVLSELQSHGITLLHVVSGSAGGEDIPPVTLLGYWKHWTGITGGDAVLQEDATLLPDTIRSLVAQASRRIRVLRLEPDPGYGTWVRSNPPQIENLMVPDTGFSHSFQATFTVPQRAEARDYLFTVRAIGDGTAYAAWNVLITAKHCGPPPPPPHPLPCETLPWSLLPWLLPLLLMALVLLLWWLAQRMIHGEDWWREKRDRGWRCLLPCLLALLYTLFVAFLLARALTGLICLNLSARPVEPPPVDIVTPAPTPTLPPGTQPPLTQAGPLGTEGSVKVARVGPMPDPGLSGVRFTSLGADELTFANLLNYDTLVLSQLCNAGQLPPSIHQDIVNWVASGRKLIIYDSDECGQPVDYGWLPYPFTTDNPGAQGSSNGVFTIVADDTMVNNDPASPHFVDAAELSHTEIGDANVMVTQDPRWCGNAMARNLHGREGFVHAYALYGNGLIIYNGLDTDSIGYPSMNKLWQNELAQIWDGVTGRRPAALTCRRRVADLTQGNLLDIWPFLIPLPILWFLCWLLCRKRVEVEPVTSPPPPSAPVRQTWVPPDPVGRWVGPPPVWNPEPTLVIGLGGAGRWVLTLLKKNLLDAGAGRISGKVHLLLLDTSEAELVDGKQSPVSFAGVQLSPEETLALGEDLSELVREMAEDAAVEPEMQSWFPAKTYARRLSDAELDLAKGTHRRRPMGRAAIFRQARRGRQGELWQRLLEGAGAVQEEDRVRIMIVGSLSGGLGGAALFDAAYLARRAGWTVGAKATTVEGFLATQHTFDRVATNMRGLAVNTFAALRELLRFQLSQDRHYPMSYDRTEAGDEVLDGRLISRLLDDCLLFDAQRPYRPLTLQSPVNGVLASIADAITLHLDRASRVGTDSVLAYRRTARQLTDGEQRRTAEAVVSSLGTFAYRLPVYDLVEALKVRWAKHLLHLFLVGDEGSEVRFDPALNQEDPTGKMEDLVYQYLRGVAGLGTMPRVAQFIFSLLREEQGWSPGRLTELQGLTVGTVEEERHSYRRYLLEGTTRLLNGSVEVDLPRARCGKIGYVLRFLERVEKLWTDVDAEVAFLRPKVVADLAERVDELRSLPASYAKATADVHRSLQMQAEMLSSRAHQEVREVGWHVAEDVEGAYEQLAAWEEELNGRREQMQAIKVRRYFLGQDLLDRWYQKYLLETMQDHLGRFYWRPDLQRLGVDLTFAGLGDEPVRASTVKAAGLASALLDLADYLASPIWKAETLAQYLSQQELQEERLPSTAKEMWEWSSPLLDFDRTAAPEVQTRVVLGANRTVEEARPLANELAVRLPSERQMMNLALTDPYTLLLAQMVDVIPAGSAVPYRDAQTYYRIVHGLTAETVGRGMGAEPDAVFAAERHALIYERRVPELEQMPRLFHPLLVAGLEDLEQARLFALAYAAGFIVRRSAVEGYVYAIQVPGREEHPLTTPQDLQDELALPVTALLNFALKQPEVVVGDVDAALGALSAEEKRDRWRMFRERELPELADKRGKREAQDLAAFISLVLRDEERGLQIS